MNFNNLVFTILEKDNSLFTCGYCAEFAFALHQYTGWPLGAFKEIEKEDEDEYYSLIHAFCYHPSGHIADVRGIRTREEVVKNLIYGDLSEASSDTTRLSEEQLSIGDLENEQGFGFNEEAIEKAQEFIEKHKNLWKL
jgi:hypothetical protein